MLAGRQRASDAEVGLEPALRAGVVAALVGSALIHGSVTGEHLAEWAAAGVFFLALEAVQLVLALLAVLAWSRPVALAVIVSGLGATALWAVSRTVGLPIGPADFRTPEAVGAPDLACCALELLAAVLAVPRVLRDPPSAPRWRRLFRATKPPWASRRASLGIAAALVAAAVATTAFGLAPALSPEAPGEHHGHEHHGAAPAMVSRL